MRIGIVPSFSTVLLISALIFCLASTAEAATGCRLFERGSTIEALGEEFPELTAWLGVFAFLCGIPDFGYWFICDALGEEYPERASSPRISEALGEEFPERAPSKDNQEALGEEFPE